jgi:hypothetical protein
MITCRNNQRQIAITTALYQDDFSQALVQNGVNGGATPADILWVYGADHGNLSALTNDTALIDPRVSLFAKYVQSKAIYKCPEDKAVEGPKKTPHARSYSMNSYIAPVKSAQNLDETGWAVFRKSTDFVNPSATFSRFDGRGAVVPCAVQSAQRLGSHFIRGCARRESSLGKSSFREKRSP